MKKEIIFLIVVGIFFTFFSCKKAPLENLTYYTPPTPIDTTPKTTTIRLSSDSVQSYCFKKNETLQLVSPKTVWNDSFLTVNITWTPGQTTDTILAISDSGNYQLQISIDSSFMDTAKIFLYYDSFLVDSIYYDSIYQSNIYSSYSYQIKITQCPSVIIPPTATGEIYIPNSFSPDEDGVNDTWHLSGGPVQSIFIEIRNNDGAVVFTGNSLEKVWDGKYSGSPVPEGYYLYYIDYTDMSGNNKTLRGRLELFRY